MLPPVAPLVQIAPPEPALETASAEPPGGVEDGWDDADEVPADDAGVAPAETTDVPIEQTMPDSMVAATPPTSDTPAPTEVVIPKKTGLALMITSGGLGAVAWGVMGWRMARIRRLCRASDDALDSVNQDTISGVVDGAGECFVSGRGGNALLWTLQAIPNAGNWGIAPAVGVIRGKYDAARFVKLGEADRNPNVFIGAGAGLLGLGVVGRLAVMVIRVRSLNPVKGVAANCIDGDTDLSTFYDCYARKNMLLYAGHQVSSAAVAGGAGLLSYGITYKKERSRLEKLNGRQAQTKFEFRVEPALARTYTGVSTTLRF
ncbi:MAG: hypothetical protein JKY37_11650 [Nannocystaceae bacterium]|nr:hypothetical protein [Nannocystaceae bacterium]